MGTLLGVIADLAKAPISRDILEKTRLGRDIKDIRRVNKDAELNKRAKDLVKKWRTIVQEEENSAVQHHSPPNFINTNSNCSTQSSGSNGSNNNGHVVHLAPSNSHHKTLSKHHRRNVVMDSPRPGTAPTSPARGRSLQPAENISRHSAPSSPASSGRHNTTVPSSSHNGAPHFPHQPPSHAVPPVRPSSPSLREVNNVANSFSRTNVANKRLRKEECINLVDEDQEPPYKRQRIAELPPPNPQQSKSLTNGGMVGDDDVISVGSSSGGSCEVIDSIDRPPPPPVFNLHQLSRASNYNHHSDISSSNVNNKSGNKRGPVGPVSPYPSESLPDGSIRLLPSSTEGLLNHATAPHDILANQSIPSAKTPSSARAGRGRGRRRSMVPSPDIKIPPNKGKVKTTSQLVAELAERKGDTMLAQRASKLEEQQKSHDDMARNKIDHVHRYVRSLPTPPPLCDPKSPLESSPLSSPVIISPEPNEDLPIEVSRPSLVPNPTDQENTQENPFSGMLDRLGVADDETEEQLLSRLPPIDFEAAAAADEQDAILDQKSYGHTEDGADYYQSKPSNGSASPQSNNSDEEAMEATSSKKLPERKKLPPESCDRLHSLPIASVNGNSDSQGNFREWHELMSLQSYLEQPLQILPYTILDF